MSAGGRETLELHTRLLKFALEVDDARAYWQRCAPGEPASADAAFAGWWFGDRSLDRVRELLTVLRLRFDAFPAALRVLHGWTDMDPATRALICHWHVQLTDPLYRAFSGDFLPERRQTRPELHRELVVAWVADQGPGRWTAATRVQFASKLLSAAHGAGLIGSTRDPRPLTTPRVPDAALCYLLHLLREVEHAGSILDNPYLRSVGLEGPLLEDRLRTLPDLGLHRMGELRELSWRFPSLEAWAAGTGRAPGSAA